MRHRKRVKKLGRTASHRKAVLANLATALIDKERIRTTDSLAKESQKMMERLITKAKAGTLHARRQVLRVIKDKKTVAKLFDTIAPRYTDRNGGYVRLIRVGNRLGDGAALSIVELIGSELEVEETKKAKKKRKKKTAETEEAIGVAPETPAVKDEEMKEDVAAEGEMQDEESEGKPSSDEEDKEKVEEESTERSPEAESESTESEKEGEGKEGRG